MMLRPKFSCVCIPADSDSSPLLQLLELVVTDTVLRELLLAPPLLTTSMLPLLTPESKLVRNNF